MRFVLLAFIGFKTVFSFSQVIEIISYSNEKIHARGIECVKNKLLLACNILE